MKKIFILIIVIITLLLFSLNECNITKDTIRFRIIPNSNSSLDILMKEKVQYEITDIIEGLKSDSIDESRVNILKNIDRIEKRINGVFEKNDYDVPFKVKYGINAFPEKIYKGVKYSEGDYESLVVEIGEAKGDNFWCVLYPPLCTIDESDEDINYKFRIIEIFEKLF